jgi:hypothetical protein
MHVGSGLLGPGSGREPGALFRDRLRVSGLAPGAWSLS